MTADVISIGTVALHLGCNGAIGVSAEGLRICNRCAQEVPADQAIIGRARSHDLGPAGWDGTGPYTALTATEASNLLSEYFRYLAVADIQGAAAAALDTGADISKHADRMAVVLHRLRIENDLLRELCAGGTPARGPWHILSDQTGRPIPGTRGPSGRIVATDAEVRDRAERTALALHQLLIEHYPLREHYLAKLEPHRALDL